MKNTFAENLKAMRKEEKLSQSEIADAVGTTQKSVSKWENKKTEPSIDDLWKLADFFGVTIDLLCGRAEW